MPDSFLHKAQGLIELLAQDPLRAHVISYLSRTVSPTGEPAAVAFIQLSRDGALHVVGHDGWAHFDPGSVTDLHIDSDRAVSQVMRSGRLRLFTQEEVRNFKTRLPVDLRTYWNSTAILPIGLQSVYYINFRENVTEIRDFEEFMDCVGSILTKFEWDLIGKSGRRRDLFFDEKNEQLSIREEQILTLIQAGMKNFEIADHLGYSESLIRQQTVAIYRKLGVRGRKELLTNESTPKRAIHSSIVVRERSSST